MRQPKKKSIRTNVQDIEVDENGRHILNTPDKIVRWIIYQFEEQAIISSRDTEMPPYHYIDLSNCVVSTIEFDDKPASMNLCEVAGKIECIINTSNKCPNCTPFHQEVLEEFHCNNSIFYASFFHCTKFHKTVKFSKTIIHGGGDWSHCEFMGDFFMQECEIEFGNFGNSIFHGIVSFSKTYFNYFQIIFYKCLFKDKARFNNVTFRNIEDWKELTYSYIKFSESTFESDFEMHNVTLPTHCWFETCVFKQIASLYNIQTAYTLSFWGTIIGNELIISSNKKEKKYQNIINKVIISHVNILGRLDFENNNIQSLNAHFSNIQSNGILRLFSNEITLCDMNSIFNRGVIFLEENKVSSITLENAVNLGVIDLENTDITTRNITNRKTARILKDSAYKSNNVIDALKYRAIELDIHKKEKDTKWYDKVALGLNKWSNWHNMNFVLGIGFTMGSAAFFYWLINYWGTSEQIFELTWQFSPKDFGDIWKKYLDVLNVLNFRDKLNGIELNAFGETLFFVSKIFVAYGVYQTIAAFRKYGKGY